MGDEVERDDDSGVEGRADKKVKSERGSTRRVTRSLRRARSLYEEGDWKPSTEADFLVREATVFALADLAEAIRDQTERSR